MNNCSIFYIFKVVTYILMLNYILLFTSSFLMWRNLKKVLLKILLLLAIWYGVYSLIELFQRILFKFEFFKQNLDPTDELWILKVVDSINRFKWSANPNILKDKISLTKKH